MLFVSAAFTEGVNVTSRVQLLLAAITPVQELFVTAKSVPVCGATLVIVTDPGLLFVIVM